MSTFVTVPPARRPDLVVGPVEVDGQCVVKDPCSGRYYHLGERETFLLVRFDGAQSWAAIRTAFEAEFGEPLFEDDLDDFLEVAREHGLIESAESAAAALPARRPELVMGPAGADGQRVVKDPRSGRYWHFGEEETFLLMQLDGMQSARDICAAFEEEFGEPLSHDDLDDFLEVARGQGLIESADSSAAALAAEPDELDDDEEAPAPGRQAAGGTSAASPRKRRRQSPLFWRMSLFDPDRLFDWLEPKLRFLWTRTFLAASAAGILAAAVLTWVERRELVSGFSGALRWDVFILAWLTLLTVTTLHEFAHGLTCKHYGGEVHEVGFLLMYFMPCLYCNVSDAWMIPEKSKRLWVTLAGGYCDMVTWAIAVFAWRITLPGTLLNHLTWVVVSVCGVRIFFNFNPFLKLDGYYLLSDLLEMPNLRKRAWASVTGHLRWLLWGSARPAPEPRGRLLLAFGAMTWAYSFVFLCLMLAGISHLFDTRWGLPVISFLVFMMGVRVRRRFRGILTGEVAKMIRMRHRRTAVWVLALGALPSVLTMTRIEDRVGGPFSIRPATRAELRAPVAGFLKAVEFEEGDRVYAGQTVARLEVPDLASRLAQKQNLVREARAKLRLLEVGPRPEEVAEKRLAVDRAKDWRDLAERDLARNRQALQDELAKLDHMFAQNHAEADFARTAVGLARKLLGKGAVSEEQYRQAEMKLKMSLSQEEQTRSEKSVRLALGTLEAEAELARRERQWAEERSALLLLEAGSRPEEVEAARALLARVEEEARYLAGIGNRLVITSPVSGVVTTPRLRERIGLYLAEGQPICEVETLSDLEAEIAVGEQDILRVRPGQAISLRARSLPFQTFAARVERIAPSTIRAQVAGGAAPRPEAAGPSAADPNSPGLVVVYCRLDGSPWGLRTGMTGYARIVCGRRPCGEILAFRALSIIRTEFWW
jgi:putative peptide zinc metalloprotease protein